MRCDTTVVVSPKDWYACAAASCEPENVASLVVKSFVECGLVLTRSDGRILLCNLLIAAPPHRARADEPQAELSSNPLGHEKLETRKLLDYQSQRLLRINWTPSPGPVP